jgi:hypothetical protein
MPLDKAGSLVHLLPRRPRSSRAAAIPSVALADSGRSRCHGRTDAGGPCEQILQIDDGRLTEAKALSAYAAYRIHEDDRVSIDLMGGFRVNSVDIDLSLSPGLLPGQGFGNGETWVDPLIGGRARFAMTDHWFATALADVGGFDVGSDLTWQVFASIGYQFNERWSVQGGWRYVAIDKEIDGRDVETAFSGPLLGFTMRF